MLPPGHFAAGYLTAQGLLLLTHANFSGPETNQLLLIGALAGFSPDLDMFYAFLRSKRFIVRVQDNNHRGYWTHAPLAWLAAGLLIYFFSQGSFGKHVGLLVWLGSWSHFVLDSFRGGVRWLFPFNRKFFAVSATGVWETPPESEFFNYWLAFLQRYFRRYWPISGLELLIIAAALLIFLK